MLQAKEINGILLISAPGRIETQNAQEVEKNFGAIKAEHGNMPIAIDQASWKNGFLAVVGELYAEAPLHNLPYIPVPQFPKFRRNSKSNSHSTLFALHLYYPNAS